MSALIDYNTNEYISEATDEQIEASRAAGEVGSSPLTQRPGKFFTPGRTRLSGRTSETPTSIWPDRMAARACAVPMTFARGDRVRVVDVNAAGRVFDVIGDQELIVVDLHQSPDRLIVAPRMLEYLD